MTLKGVISCLPILERLAKTKSSLECRRILQQCPNCVFYAISEICHNIIKGNIPITKYTKKKLNQYKGRLRELAKKATSLEKRRKIVHQIGGALQALLTPAISFLTAYLARKLA